MHGLFRFVCILLLTATALANPEKEITAEVSPEPPPPSDSLWQVLFQSNAQQTLNDQYLAGACWAGGYYFITGSGPSLSSTTDNKIYRLNPDGSWNATYNQPSISSGWGFRDLCFDGQYLYGGCEASQIYAFDLTGSLVPTLNIPKPPGLTEVRALTYDPATQHFWGGSLNLPLYEFDRSGAVISTSTVGLTGIFGMAWDAVSSGGPWLWIFTQSGTPLTTIHKFSALTHQVVASYQLPLPPGMTTAFAGGCEGSPSWGTCPFALIALVQGAPGDHLVAYEIVGGGSTPNLNITLSPVNPPITILPGGGAFNYTAVILNNAFTYQSFQAWIMMQMPDGSWSGPVVGPVSLALPPGGSLARLRSQTIPLAYPTGDYFYEGRVGYYPGTVWDTDGFAFTKQGPPDVLWTCTYGGWNVDYGYNVDLTEDQGYVITGYTNTFSVGYDDVYLVKTDSSGNQQWQHSYGGGSIEQAFSVQQTNDGGYILTGMTNSFGMGSNDVYLIKTDSSGDTSWTKTFGGSSNDGGNSVEQTSDGGYIVVGFTYSFGGSGDVYLFKTDASGNLVWHQTIGGNDYDYGFSVHQTTDGGFILCGGTYSTGAGSFEVLLVKTDPWGLPMWQQTFGGSGLDNSHCLQQTSDGGYIIAGRTASLGAQIFDVFLVKTNAAGNLQWQRTYGGSNDDWGYSVRQTSDGGYIIAGGTSSYGAGGYDAYLLKTDASGLLQWQQTSGGTLDDWSQSVVITANGDYVLAGKTHSSGAGNDDVYLIRVASETVVNTCFGVAPQTEVLNAPTAYSLSHNYPNPFNPTTIIPYTLAAASHVNMAIYDVTGRLVATIVDGWREVGSQEVTFDGSSLTSGMYVYRLSAGDFHASGKMVLVK